MAGFTALVSLGYDLGVFQFAFIFATNASYIILNATGQPVAILPTIQLEAGMNELPVSSTGLPAGTYWIRLQVGAQSGTLTFTQL